MLDKILNLFSEVIFYVFAVTSVLFGVSLAVNLLITKTIKKVRFESDKNYHKLSVEEQAKCDEIITTAKQELSLLAQQNKINKKIRQNNRFLKFFHLKQKEEIVVEKNFKNISNDVLQKVFNVFNDKENKTYLSLSERDVFLIAISLKDRLNSLISSSNIIWLKRLPISVVLYCLRVYNATIKIKNKFFVALTLKIIEFFSWFAKLISPTSVWKVIVKNLSGDTLEEIITNSIIEIVVKELCVVYKDICDKNVSVNI